MTAKEKFEAKLLDLGLLEEWKQQGSFGKVAKEIEDGIILFVHEDDGDNFSEERFPTFAELRQDPNFVKECKDEWFGNTDDYEFEAKLACWLDGYSKDCPLYPVDVYFPGNAMSTYCQDFEDDEVIDLELEEEEEYQHKVADYADELNVILKYISLHKYRVAEMIRTEFRRGHNLQSDFDPYPGWGSHHLCGYEIELKTMVVEELEDGTMCLALYSDGCEVTRLAFTASDFPVEVLFNIYNQMK